MHNLDFSGFILYSARFSVLNYVLVFNVIYTSIFVLNHDLNQMAVSSLISYMFNKYCSIQPVSSVLSVTFYPRSHISGNKELWKSRRRNIGQGEGTARTTWHKSRPVTAHSENRATFVLSSRYKHQKFNENVRFSFNVSPLTDIQCTEHLFSTIYDSYISKWR